MNALAEEILAEIRARPRQFHDIVLAHMDVPWPDLLRAWGELRAAGRLGRDEDGSYTAVTDG